MIILFGLYISQSILHALNCKNGNKFKIYISVLSNEGSLIKALLSRVCAWYFLMSQTNIINHLVNFVSMAWFDDWSVCYWYKCTWFVYVLVRLGNLHTISLILILLKKRKRIVTMERVATEPNLFLLYIFMLMSVDLNRKKRIILLLII